MVKDIDLIYIAGFFDGEGCISGIMCRGRGKHPIVRIAIGQKRPEILYWIKETLEMGSVSKNSRGISSLRIYGKENIGKFISLVLPYSKVKKEELIVGQKLNNLVVGSGHSINFENHQERVKLLNQLKLLKKGEVL